MGNITLPRSVVEQALLALRTDDLSLVRESVIALNAALKQKCIIASEAGDSTNRLNWNKHD